MMMNAVKQLSLLCALCVNYTAAVNASSEPPVPHKKMERSGTAKQSSKGKSPFLQLKEMFLLSNSMLDWSSSETIMYNSFAENHNVPSSSSSVSVADSYAKGQKGNEIGKDEKTKLETEKNNGSLFLSNRLDARMVDFSSSSTGPPEDHKSSLLAPEQITHGAGLKSCEKEQTCQESLLNNKSIGAGETISINVERLDAFIQQHDSLFLWLAFGLVSIALIIMQVRYNIAKPRPKIKVKNWRAKVRNWDEDEAAVLKEAEDKPHVTISNDTVEVREDIAQEIEPKAKDNDNDEDESNLNVSLILEAQQANTDEAKVETTKATWLTEERTQADVLVAMFKNEEEELVANGSDEVGEAHRVTDTDTDTELEAESIDTDKENLAQEIAVIGGLILDTDQKKELDVEKSPVRSTSSLQADKFVSKFESGGVKRMTKKIEKDKVKEELQRLASRKTARMIADIEERLKAKEVNREKVRMEKEISIRAKQEADREREEKEARINAEEQKRLDLHRSATEARIKSQQEIERLKAEEEAQSNIQEEPDRRVKEASCLDGKAEICLSTNIGINNGIASANLEGITEMVEVKNEIIPASKEEEALRSVDGNTGVEDADEQQAVMAEEDLFGFNAAGMSSVGFSDKNMDDACIKNEEDNPVEADEIFGTWEIEDDLACIEDEAEADWLNTEKGD